MNEIYIHLFIIILSGLFSYLILHHKAYALVSGFNTKSDEEQQRLIEKGYPQAIGKFLLHATIILSFGLILELILLPYALSFSYLIMAIYLFTRLFFINRMFKSKKINQFILFISILLVVSGLSLPFFPTNVTITNNNIKFNGLYGIEWDLDDITTIELLNEIPEIERRTNGATVFDKRIGNYQLERFGKGKLFLKNMESPFVYIKKDDTYVF
ncbi:DUF3784 domain-containing protein [Oceanobacillus kimchii]|uniref:DUF3784 domain-containing protein n=1 Tax=Oceanobacillus kimchii TaxID=746691 RepID=UPI0021A9437A|nr:DUF3784 domain-containing protein [Oceanobacillus kimchii]MCT1578223.1 DUF3784 domain-containing protein [Oceanobacillus kimchii]MCT2134401.1 DUF3784 domain-containing protein [Oceanobacillus kimchii]